MEYYTAERKEELLPFTTAWMDLESIMLSEISQVVKDRYHDLTCKWNLTNKTNKQAKQNQRHGNKEHTESDQRCGGNGGKGEGLSRNTHTGHMDKAEEG